MVGEAGDDIGRELTGLTVRSTHSPLTASRFELNYLQNICLAVQLIGMLRLQAAQPRG